MFSHAAAGPPGPAPSPPQPPAALPVPGRAGRWPSLPHQNGQVLRLVLVVLLLLFARSLGGVLEGGARWPLTHREQWHLVFGFLQLVVMVLPILAAILVMHRRPGLRGARRVAAMVAVVLAATALGAALRLALMLALGATMTPPMIVSLLSAVVPRYALLGGLVALALELWSHAETTHAAAVRAAVDGAALERELADSRLQVLRAQIEPHFLFNTLANLRRLYETDLQRGHAMLDSLTHYLGLALPALRQPMTSLAQEVDLALAWLRIQQMRMGARLQFSADVPPALAGCSVPPMMLLTLVENAVQHGLQPIAAGGGVQIAAQADNGVLRLSVSDTGAGLQPGSGSGMGLSNIRARLSAQFGPVAGLALESRPGGGTVATLSLPQADTLPGPRA